MKYVGDGHDIFYLKPSRKLLDEGNNQIIQMSSSITSDRPWFWFCLIVTLILFFLILVRCCIKLASDVNDETQGITVHPPPQTQPPILSYVSSRPSAPSYGRSRPSAPSYGSSRPLAPPRSSSRSLILLPEPGTDQNLYFEIENPNINLFAIYHDTSGQINPQSSIPTPNDPPLSIILPHIPLPSNSPTQLHDLPPDYNSIVTDNQQNDNRSTSASNVSKDFENSEKMPPPKYEDLH